MWRFKKSGLEQRVFTPPRQNPQNHLQIPLAIDYDQRDYFQILSELASKKVTFNVGHYYAGLFTAMFGGKISRPSKLTFERVAEGLKRNFHPDIIKKHNNATHYIEVKSVHRRSNRPSISFLQVENYAYNLAKKLDAEDASVWFSFFRYNRGDGFKPSEVDYHSLVSHLSENTLDMAIVPFNILIYLLLNSKKFRHDQRTNTSTIDYRDYWIPFASQMNALFEGVGLLNGLERKDSADREWQKELLCLDGTIEMRKFQSPQNLVCRPSLLYGETAIDYTVSHFQITLYSTDPNAWRDSFKKNHKGILGHLGIQDLYDPF